MLRGVIAVRLFSSLRCTNQEGCWQLCNGSRHLRFYADGCIEEKQRKRLTHEVNLDNVNKFVLKRHELLSGSHTG